MMNRLWKVGLVVLALAVLLGALHTPPVRSWCLKRAAAYASMHYGVVLTAERLDYNLLRLTFRVCQLRIACRATPGVPFLKADELAVDIPWNTIIGMGDGPAIKLYGGAINVVRDAGGRLNLPPGGNGPRGGPGLGRLRFDAPGVSIDFHDEQRNVRIATADVSLLAEVARTGSLRASFGEPARWEARSRTGSIEISEAVVRFDEGRVSLAPITTRAREGTIRLHGRIDRDSETIEATARATYDLASLFPERGLQGELMVLAQASGTVSSPIFSFDVISEETLCGRLRIGDLAVGAKLERGVLDVPVLSARVANGEIRGTARLDVGEAASNSLKLEWHSAGASALLHELLPATPPESVPEGILQGKATFDWAGARFERCRLRLVNSIAPPAGRPGISGRTVFEMEADRSWSLDASHSLGRLGRWDASLHGDPGTAVGGSVTGQGISVESAVSLVTTLLAPKRRVPWMPSGTGSVRAEVAGTFEQPKLDARVAIDGLRSASAEFLPAARLSAHVRAERTKVDIDSVELTAGGIVSGGRGTISLPDGTMTVDVKADCADLSEVPLGIPWNPGGSVHASGSISGTVKSPRAVVEIDAAPLCVAGQSFDHVAGELTYERGAATARLTADQADGHVELNGRYAGPTEFSLEASGQNLRVDRVPAAYAGQRGLPLRARLDFRARAEGLPDGPRASGELRIEDAYWADRPLGGASLLLDLRDDWLFVESAGGAVRGWTSLDGAHMFEVQASAEGFDLAALESTMASTPLAGAVSFDGRLNGTLSPWRLGRLDLSLRHLDARAGGVSIRTERPGRVAIGPDAIEADVELLAGASKVAAVGGLGVGAAAPLDVSLAGEIGDVVPFLELLGKPSPVAGQGMLNAQVRVAGDRLHPQVAGEISVEAGSLEIPRLGKLDGLDARACLDGSALAVEHLIANWRGASIVAEGNLPLAVLSQRWAAGEGTSEAIRLTAHVANFRADSLPVNVRPPGNVGWTASADITLQSPSLDLRRARGHLGLRVSDASASGIPLRTDGPAAVDLEAGRMTLHPWTWTGEGISLTLSGGLELGETIGQSRLDLQAAGETRLQVLSASVPGVELGGRTELQIRLHGPLAHPVPEGEINLYDCEAWVRQARVFVDGLSGTLRLSSGGLEAVGVKGMVNGGTLDITGQIGLLRPADAGSRLACTVRNAGLDWPRGWRTELNADLALTMKAGRPVVSGEIEVLRGDFRGASPVAGLHLSYGQPDPLALATRSPIDNVALDLRLRTKEDLRVDSNYGRVGGGFDFRLTGDVGMPGMQGRVFLSPGSEVYFGGTTYLVESATLEFPSAISSESRLTASATTKVAGYFVMVSLTGDLQKVKTHLVSEPDLPENEILSLLLTGQKTGAGGSVDLAKGGSVADILSAGLLGSAGRALNLSGLRIQRGDPSVDPTFDPMNIASETNPTSRITASKAVGPNVTVTFSQSLQNAGGLTWVIDYTPLRQVELRAVKQDDDTRFIEFRHDLSFGGGSGRPATAHRPLTRKVPAERIQSISFSGDPLPSDLRRALRLSVGARFDYYKWREDRDRLQAALAKAGFLESRVGARRDPPFRSEPHEGDLVRLDYSVRRGPRTEIVVTGRAAEELWLREIRQVWQTSESSRFLEEESARRVLVDLSSRGFVRARVSAKAVKSADGDKKTLYVTVDPGPRSDSKKIVFEGNVRIDERRLVEVASRPEVKSNAWADPTSLAHALLALYRSEGMISAEFDVGPPRFFGQRAELPVHIKEGPQFVISVVRVQGTRSISEDRVRQAAGLSPGQPLRIVTLLDAYRRILQLYHNLGFAAVDVDVNVRRAPDGDAAEVDLVVKEGRQQILKEVVVDGLRRISPRAVSPATSLETGKPVAPAQLERAQKKIVDTGAFRRVDFQIEPLAVTPDAAAEPVRLRLLVEEWAPWRLRYGLQLLDQPQPLADEVVHARGLGGVVDITRRALAGRPFAGGLSLRYSKEYESARAYASIPRAFGLPIRSSLYLTLSREHIWYDAKEFLDTETGLTFEQRARIGSLAEVAYAYEIQWLDLQSAQPIEGRRFDFDARLARITATLALDRRDDFMDPMRGWFHSTGVEYAAPAIGSQVDLQKILIQQFAYLPLYRKTVLALAARYENSAGAGEALLATDRLPTGGANTVRGYPDDWLDIRDVVDLLGGRSGLLILNEELRVPLWRSLRGAAFLDYGRLRSTLDDRAQTISRLSTGLGLRYRTPFGLFRLDYGHPIGEGSTGLRGRWYFTLGQAF
ncbi:MAG: translocation/assembly module TamB domain-containing protein [Acidobacteriota bacterium]